MQQIAKYPGGTRGYKYRNATANKLQRFLAIQKALKGKLTSYNIIRGVYKK
jgi:hypothetical protein